MYFINNNNSMQRTQNKKNEILLCTYGKCEKPQTADGEYCLEHCISLYEAIKTGNTAEIIELEKKAQSGKIIRIM